jgi:quinol monooxygenase YgiN
VVALVREAIIPAYRQLPGCLGLGLLRIEGTGSYLATQDWESRETYKAALSMKFYVAWWAAYQPALARWNELVTLEDGWEAVDLLP